MFAEYFQLLMAEQALCARTAIISSFSVLHRKLFSAAHIN
jgi:hypothetical protein